MMTNNTQPLNKAALATRAIVNSLKLDIGNVSRIVKTIVLLCLLPLSTAHAATYLYHNDHLGTPQALTDANQQVVWQSEQDPFGEVEVTTNLVEQNIRFPGQYFDVETGLHYNYHRDFDPRTGRYIQSDPIGLKAGVNTFGYVAQNPLSYSDPLGLDLVVVIGHGHLANIYGHAAVATTGSGVYSRQTDHSLGGSFSDFLKDRTAWEGMMLIEVTNLSSEEEKSIIDHFVDGNIDSYNFLTSNCATTIHDALEDTVGFPFNVPRTLGISTPANLGWRAELYSSLNKGKQTYLGKGSPIPT